MPSSQMLTLLTLALGAGLVLMRGTSTVLQLVLVLGLTAAWCTHRRMRSVVRGNGQDDHSCDEQVAHDCVAALQRQADQPGTAISQRTRVRAFVSRTSCVSLSQSCQSTNRGREAPVSTLPCAARLRTDNVCHHVPANARLVSGFSCAWRVVRGAWRRQGRAGVVVGGLRRRGRVRSTQRSHLWASPCPS